MNSKVKVNNSSNLQTLKVLLLVANILQSLWYSILIVLGLVSSLRSDTGMLQFFPGLPLAVLIAIGCWIVPGRLGSKSERAWMIYLLVTSIYSFVFVLNFIASSLFIVAYVLWRKQKKFNENVQNTNDLKTDLALEVPKEKELTGEELRKNIVLASRFAFCSVPSLFMLFGAYLGGFGLIFAFDDSAAPHDASYPLLVLALGIVAILLTLGYLAINILGTIFTVKSLMQARKIALSINGQILALIGYSGALFISNLVPIIGSLVTLSSPILMLIAGISLRKMSKKIVKLVPSAQKKEESA